MRYIHVEYDAYNRRFKLLDQNFAHDLKDGDTYLIAEARNSETALIADLLTASRENGNAPGVTDFQSWS